MTDSDIEILKNEIDAVIEKYRNEKFLFQDFENYSKPLRNTFFKNQKIHKEVRVCGVIGCQKNTIKKSHSIPKSSVLKNITIDGHLLTPQFDSSNNYPRNIMAKIGINNASVFPGFCIKHEGIFNSFETDGKIDNARKALLQTFRTLCRERVYRENELKINKVVRKHYKKKVNEEVKESLNDALSKYPQFNEINNINIKGIDSALDSLNKMDNFLLKPLKQIKIFEENIYSSLLDLSTKSDLIVRVVNIDIHLPVSLCGIANQVYIENKVEKDAYLLLNVMPKKESTDVICVGLEKDKALIEKYLDFSFSNPLYIVNLIESFMVNGSDHWFINPDFWKKLPEIKQKKILYDILFTEDSFLDEYPISIFDDIRTNIISILNHNISLRDEEISKNEQKRIAMEIDKIKSANYSIITDADILGEKLWNNLQKH
tara:strand:- start:4 stop:1293 length:1290 start_codon:yes stop_codon:yes gene_type:complete